MAGYDPQRDRSRRRIEDDEGPAPIDEMLGAAGDATVPGGTGARLVGTVTAGVETTSPKPAPDPVSAPDSEREPPALEASSRRVVLVVVLAFVALVVAMAVRRRRRATNDD